MFVCYCRAVTDDVIRDAVARGARSIPALAAECGAGARCRSCWPALQELIADESRRAVAPAG